ISVRENSVIAAEGDITGAVDIVVRPRVAAVINTNNTPNDPNDDSVQTPARDWGALIRVSNAGDARILREGVDTTNTNGSVVIESGAALRAGKSLPIDATRSTSLAASARVSGTSLIMSGGRIGLGGGSTGLIFDDAALAQLATASNLRLRSYSTIDF